MSALNSKTSARCSDLFALKVKQAAEITIDTVQYAKAQTHVRAADEKVFSLLFQSASAMFCMIILTTGFSLVERRLKQAFTFFQIRSV